MTAVEVQILYHKPLLTNTNKKLGGDTEIRQEYLIKAQQELSRIF